MRGVAAAVFVAFLCSACASKTRIYTLPAGADLTLNQEKQLGKSPVEIKESVWIWTKHKVTAELDGYQTKTIQVKSLGMRGAGFAACACSLGLLLPFMFLTEYEQPQYLMEMEAIDAEQESNSAVTYKAKINFNSEQ